MKYRRDIDGMRAVAVVPVILFHAGANWLPGGFVGVDVFFVISGFLITGILISELDKSRFSIVRFYERRARRILPALLAMLVASIPFAIWLMLPGQLELFSKAMMSIMVFSSNILFWKNVDYFASSAAENPLLHTWSLAVEEQFYVIFPLMLWAMWRVRRKQVLPLIILLTLCSLLLSQWASSRYPAPNFYLLPTRAWELGLGAIAAFLIRRPNHVPRPALSLLGLIMILAATAFFNEEMPAPSFYTLLPVIGATFVVLYGGESEGKRSLADRILSWGPLVGIGLISYSAYIWHQPILAFARLAQSTAPSMAQMYGLALLSLIIGWVSWKYIEQPFRRPDKRWLSSNAQLFSVSATGMIALSVLAWIGIAESGFKKSWRAKHADQPHLIAALDYRGGPDHVRQFTEADCFADGNASADFEKFRHCLLLDDDKANYLLIGDSFSAHYAIALSDTYPENNIIQATMSGCRPIWNGRGSASCNAIYDRQIRPFIESNATKLAGIIISARWRAIDAKDLEKTVRWIIGLGVPVAVFGPSPEYGFDFPAVLIKAGTQVSEQPVNYLSSPERWRVQDILDKEVTRAGGIFIRVMDALCNKDQACLSYSDTGEPMHFDYGHLTISGAMKALDLALPDTLDELFACYGVLKEEHRLRSCNRYQPSSKLSK